MLQQQKIQQCNRWVFFKSPKITKRLTAVVVINLTTPFKLKKSIKSRYKMTPTGFEPVLPPKSGPEDERLSDMQNQILLQRREDDNEHPEELVSWDKVKASLNKRANEWVSAFIFEKLPNNSWMKQLPGTKLNKTVPGMNLQPESKKRLTHSK